jgi:lysophospholipase L1-like esterase
VSCPAPQTLISPLATPIPVVYAAATVIGGKTPVTVTCTPSSGSTFPVGSTTVTCTATDAAQRTSSCSLTITVNPPPHVQFTRYFAFGDSMTAGEDGLNSITAEVNGLLQFTQPVLLVGRDYPSVLRSALQARYTLQTDAIAVSNQGKPGEQARSADALSRFTQLARGGGFQVALLMEGANDVYESYYSGSGVLSTAINGLQGMIRAARNNGLRVYLATIPPQNRAACTPICRGIAADLVPGYNDRVRNLAISEGVSLIDVYTAFGGDLSLLSPDGLHPNANGYERIADTFFQGIKATIETQP